MRHLWVHYVILGLILVLVTGLFAVTRHASSLSSFEASMLGQIEAQQRLASRIAQQAGILADGPSSGQLLSARERLYQFSEDLNQSLNADPFFRLRMPDAAREIYEREPKGIDSIISEISRSIHEIKRESGVKIRAIHLTRLAGTDLRELFHEVVDTTRRENAGTLRILDRTEMAGTIVLVGLLATWLMIFAVEEKRKIRMAAEIEMLRADTLRAAAYGQHQREFIAMTNHELRTSLAVIDGRARQITRRARETNDEHLMPRSKEITRHVQRLLDLMSAMLDRERIESGATSFKPAQIDPKQVTGELQYSIREMYPEHQFYVEYETGLGNVYCDANLLRQILWNLLSNAARFSPGGTDVFLGITRDAAGNCVLSVTDAGVGIPEDEMDKIFERFCHASTGAGRSGTGIGLHLVKNFVERHGGTIQVESEVGVGTTFIVTLPDLVGALAA